MKIITKHPVVYKSSSADGDYSGLDGKSPSKQVSFFQNWVNKFRGEKLKVDGKWGSKTSKAWAKHGADFEKAAMGANTLINSALTTSGGGATPTEANAGKPNTNKLKDLFAKGKGIFDKANEKGLVDKAKGTLGLGQQGGGAAGIGNTEYSGGESTPTDGKGMPKALKIGLFIAAGLGVALLIVKMTKKK